MLEVVRAHWSIENNLHWVLDVLFDEDACRSRKDHAAENLALIRKLAINTLQQRPVLPASATKCSKPDGIMTSFSPPSPICDSPTVDPDRDQRRACATASPPSPALPPSSPHRHATEAGPVPGPTTVIFLLERDE
ncbi:ISAs1 family transposase [Bradyrhizobium vignae]|uniref:ISAs1 family transposase n=1 Tax=Bradyrhizobium vignae TaxID=1549949 RepID=UPI0035DF3D5E